MGTSRSTTSSWTPAGQSDSPALVPSMDVMKRLGITRHRLDSLVKEGRLTRVWKGGNQFYPLDDLERIENEQTEPRPSERVAPPTQVRPEPRWANAPPLLSIRKASDLYGVSASLLSAGIKKGQIATTRLGERVYIQRDPFEALIGVA